ncbi:MAG: HEPN domain-containing protein [Synergistaceae bacterium]|nr:HEPN domain-containing protein [Synergistaceae bacterium]
MDRKNRLDLSRYRMDKAKSILETSKIDFAHGDMNSSANRSYYAIFHALRAVLAIDGFDSKKHKGIIAYFNRNYVKTRIFPVDTSEIIDSAFEERSNADYEDYYEVTTEAAQEQISNAEYIISIIQPYLESTWAEMESKS